MTFLMRQSVFPLLMIRVLLGGMEHINEHWDYAIGESGDMYEDDDDRLHGNMK